jgi:imidazoleglycerol phosphate synthase glutamine amidotransferase subunit HisH
VLATSHYAEDFVAAVCKGNAMATQFHPEKSGVTGQHPLDCMPFASMQQQQHQPAAAAAE